ADDQDAAGPNPPVRMEGQCLLRLADEPLLLGEGGEEPFQTLVYLRKAGVFVQLFLEDRDGQQITSQVPGGARKRHKVHGFSFARYNQGRRECKASANRLIIKKRFTNRLVSDIVEGAWSARRKPRQRSRRRRPGPPRPR